MRLSIYQYISIFLSAICGLLFAYSAYTKLYPIEGLEYSIADTGIIGWQMSMILARLLIGFEFLSAILLFAHLYIKKYSIPVVTFTLFIFTLYLLTLIAKYGNTGNCGCFGEAIKLSPLEGIVKNLLLLFPLTFIYFYGVKYTFPYQKIVVSIIALLSLLLPFILNPIYLSIPPQYLTETVNYKLELDILYNDEQNSPPNIELREGKHLISFMSLSCPHCRLAAQKLHVIKQRNPQISIHLVLNGDKALLPDFFEATRANNLSWSLFIGADKFLKLSSPKLPQIYLVNQSIVEKKCNYLTIEQSEIEEWLFPK